MPERGFKLKDGMIPLAALSAQMVNPVVPDLDKPSQSAAQSEEAPIPIPGLPTAELTGRSAAGTKVGGAKNWGPEHWPATIRDSVEEWPPKFRERELYAAVKAPFAGPRRVVFMAGKNGVGKSTIAQLMQRLFAQHRSGGAVVLDANGEESTAPGLRLDPIYPPKDGAVMVVPQTGVIFDGEVQRIGSADMTVVTPTKDDTEYGRLCNLLAEHYQIVLCDVGVHLDREVAAQLFDIADQVVVVATPRVDGVYTATTALNNLREFGYTDLADNAIVALNCIRKMEFSNLVNIDRHFRKLASKVVRITWDDALDQGELRNLDQMSPTTRTGMYELAAALTERFISQVNQPTK